MSEENPEIPPETQPEETVEEPKQEEAPAAEEPKEEAKEEAPKAAPACSGECPWEQIAKPFQESPFFAKAKEIFMWNDLMTSLACFVVINIFFVLLVCYDFTVVGLICWIAFFALLAALVFDIMYVIAFFKGEEAKSNLADKNIPLPGEYIDGFFKLVGDVVKAFLGVCINAVLLRSIPFSIGMIFGFLFLIYLAGHMGICGMLYVAILFCFIWFRLYNDHHDKIDELWEKLKSFVKEQYQKVMDNINKPKQQ
jgi:hypothetical protein